MDRTTPNRNNGAHLLPAVTFTLLLGVGTGGDYTPKYHELREGGFALRKSRDVNAERASTIAADIEHVKFSLKVTMAELARCLGVSRQAPYNWIAGGAIKPENLAKFESLRDAAHVIVAANLPNSPLLLQRKLPGGKTILEAIAAGMNGSDAAHALIEMVEREQAQRQIMTQLLAGRGVPKAS